MEPLLSWLGQLFSGSQLRREREAFDALYRAHSGWIFRRLRSLGNDAAIAEEAVNEAFVVYWERYHVPVLRGEDGPKVLEDPASWILRVARNKTTDAYRQQLTARQKRDALAPVEGMTGGQMDVEEREFVRQTLASLDERTATLLVGREVEGWSYDEISEHMGIERGSVGTLLRRARQAFERQYQALSEAGDAKDES